jgi:AcrR family transcriptional regulator
VWLAPGEDWRARYRGWKALHKLEYVDELMRSLAGRPPPHQPAYRVADLDCLNVKLKTYYARKRKQYEDTYPDFYDNDLRTLFAAGAEGAGGLPASKFLRAHRRALMLSVCQWTNQRKYAVNRLLARLIERCDQLGLLARPDDPRLLSELTAYITTLVMNHLFTGKFKRTK